MSIEPMDAEEVGTLFHPNKYYGTFKNETKAVLK